VLEGNLSAPILIVVDKPGVQEKAEGTCLSGRRREVLMNAFGRAGIPLASIALCFEADYETIKASQANVLVPLGDSALFSLTGLESADKWHCSTISASAQWGGRKCVPLLHPERVLKSFGDSAYLTLGAQRVASECREHELRVPQRTFHITPTYKEALEFLHEAQFKEDSGIDIETSCGQINTFGVSIDKGLEAMAIRTTQDHWTPEEWDGLWRAIAGYCESSVPKIAQNFIYESMFLSAYGINLTNVTWDTMWAMKFLHPELEKGLHNVGRFYTPFPYWKDDNDDWNSVQDWPRHLGYNCSDHSGTLWAYHEQKKEMEDANLLKPFQDLCLSNIEIIREMCHSGFLLDEGALQLQRDKARRELDGQQEFVDRYFLEHVGRKINVRSPKQLKDALRQLGVKLPVQKGKESTDKKALVKLRKKHPDMPLLASLLSISKENKKLSSYLEFGYDHDTKIVRYSLDGVGTETGRFCLRKGTKVSLVGREIAVEDVKVGDLAYCYDDSKNLCLRPVTWAGQTGKKKLVRIHWHAQTGRKGYLDLTPEHRVRLIDGSYKRADQLQPKDRTLALRRYLDEGYYKLIGRNKKDREHVFIFKQLHGYQPEVVHHIDGNSLNNAPENLEATTISAHVSEHAKQDKRKPPKQPSHEERARGARVGTARLNEQQVLEIKTMLAQGKPRLVIAAAFGVSVGCIKSIKQGRNWKHVQLNNHIIERIEELNIEDDVYDLEIEQYHNFIANEICVHNSSYTDPWGNGFNAQTVPKYIRKCFQAKPGHVLVQIDLSQAESRYVAYDGPDPKLMELLETGKDVHTFVAGRIFNKNPDMIGKNSKERQLGKKAGHASNYGTGPKTFAEMCLVDLDHYITDHEAARIIEAYYGVFPGIRRRQLRIQDEIRKTKTLRTPLGRERIFHDYIGDNLFREAYAYAPQSTIPDITNALMRYLHQTFEEARFLVQVHDSILIEVEEGRQYELAEAARDYGSWHPKIELMGGRLIIPVDCEWGTHWEPMEKM
jgi:DNA polymerase I-like protein with 3'-5' exonuclease and polymerase domains